MKELNRMNLDKWMKYRFKKTVSIKEAITSHNKLIKNLNDMSKIEMNLVCPNCKTFLKSNDGQKEPNVSICPECNNTGWKLRSNGKIPVEETLELRQEIRFESLPISEPMIKCSCGINYR